ncbi:hypothetical protein FA15DRAFT_660478 [Coprinopsis marcescibilis]|uniref:Uncharacterized protein n=1 Tax=Coprinopsis marcescibilis TaxID=230819 RepID=A0A5C3KF71_COPMA|nr:hypothetical protein FA15DRAFT_660478 [Coprinopsis marcescibilis]
MSDNFLTHFTPDQIARLQSALEVQAPPQNSTNDLLSIYLPLSSNPASPSGAATSTVPGLAPLGVNGAIRSCMVDESGDNIRIIIKVYPDTPVVPVATTINSLMAHTITHMEASPFQYSFLPHLVDTAIEEDFRLCLLQLVAHGVASNQASGDVRLTGEPVLQSMTIQNLLQAKPKYVGSDGLCIESNPPLFCDSFCIQWVVAGMVVACQYSDHSLKLQAATIPVAASSAARMLASEGSISIPGFLPEDIWDNSWQPALSTDNCDCLDDSHFPNYIYVLANQRSATCTLTDCAQIPDQKLTEAACSDNYSKLLTATRDFSIQLELASSERPFTLFLMAI